jgi:hypothetical protein
MHVFSVPNLAFLELQPPAASAILRSARNGAAGNIQHAGDVSRQR